MRDMHGPSSLSRPGGVHERLPQPDYTVGLREPLPKSLITNP
jgi:hypothetical protein